MSWRYEFLLWVLDLTRDMGLELTSRASLVFLCILFRLPNAPSIPTAIAYFSVSKLELPASASGTGVASGKYGCHIDPSTTTMIQTGLTNGPVPDAYGYLGIGALFSSLLHLPSVLSLNVSYCEPLQLVLLPMTSCKHCRTVRKPSLAD